MYINVYGVLIYAFVSESSLKAKLHLFNGLYDSG